MEFGQKKKEKSMNRLFVLLAVCLCVLAVLSSPCIHAQIHTNVKKLVQSNSQFAFDLYNQIRHEDGNIFFSPYSISAILALAYGGARAETARQMATVLNFPLESEKLHSAFSDIHTRLNVSVN
jgi:serpin B